MTTVSARFSIHPNDLPGGVKAGFADAIDRLEKSTRETGYVVDWTSIQFDSNEVFIEELSHADGWQRTSWTDVDVTVRAVKGVR